MFDKFFFICNVFQIVGIITRHNLTHEFLVAKLRQHYITIWIDLWLHDIQPTKTQSGPKPLSPISTGTSALLNTNRLWMTIHSLVQRDHSFSVSKAILLQSTKVKTCWLFVLNIFLFAKKHCIETYDIKHFPFIQPHPPTPPIN